MTDYLLHKKTQTNYSNY